MAIVHRGAANSRQCFTGTVVLAPTQGVGVTKGVLTAKETSIPIRQVPGTNVRGVPLSQLDGKQAMLCGSFIQDASGIVFSVNFASLLPE